MRVFLMFLIISLLASSCRQKTEKLYYNTGELYVVRTFETQNVFFEKSFFKDGKLKFDGKVTLQGKDTLLEQYKMYRPDGSLFAWANDTVEVQYESGDTIRSICGRKNFKKNGKFKGFNEGKLFLEVNFKNDKKNGELICFDTETGKILHKEYYENDVQTGPTTHYWPNGKFKKVVYYKEKCIEKAEYFDEYGKLEKTVLDKDSLFELEGRPFGCVY